MRKPKTVETREELLEALVEDAAREHGANRFKLKRTGYGGRKWALELTGTGGSWRHNNLWKIPDEIGDALALGWSTSKYGKFVGARGATRLLEDLGAEGYEEKIQALKDERARAEREYRVRNAREGVTRVFEKVVGRTRLLTRLADAVELDACPEAAEELEAALEALTALNEALNTEEEA